MSAVKIFSKTYKMAQPQFRGPILSDGPPPKVAAKKEVSLFDSDYWQSLQNGKPSLVSSTPATKSKAENVVKKELVEPDQWKKFSGYFSLELPNVFIYFWGPHLLEKSYF